MGDWIAEGRRAPAFTLTSDDGSKVKLSDLKGGPVVLYFYPKSIGIQRSTFLIDAQGRIAKAWIRVKVDGHAQQVIDAVKELSTA